MPSPLQFSSYFWTNRSLGRLCGRGSTSRVLYVEYGADKATIFITPKASDRGKCTYIGGAIYFINSLYSFPFSSYLQRFDEGNTDLYIMYADDGDDLAKWKEALQRKV